MIYESNLANSCHFNDEIDVDCFFFFSSRRRHTRLQGDWSSDVCSSDLDVDLAQFPVPVCWPEDGGPYITLAGVITRDPKTGVRNVGMYRVQVIGRRELAMHWQRHKVGAAHWREMAERGDKMPVAIALGGDPASIYAASAPLPPTIDEFLFAGFLRRGPGRLPQAGASPPQGPAGGESRAEGQDQPPRGPGLGGAVR